MSLSALGLELTQPTVTPFDPPQYVTTYAFSQGHSFGGFSRTLIEYIFGGTQSAQLQDAEW